MKKMLKVLFGLFVMTVVSFMSVSAFNPVTEMNSVSKSPATAYTLYIGMPENEFNDNFSSLPGWERLTDTHWGHGLNGVVFVRSDNKGVYIREELNIGIVAGKVYSYEVRFRTESADLANQLRDTAYNNISTKLGAPSTSNFLKSNKKSWDWSLDGGNTTLQIATSESNLAAVRSSERYIISISRTQKM